MRNLILAAVAGVSLFLCSGPAFGFGRSKGCCEPSCCTPCCTPCETKVQYVDKVVTCYKPVTVTKTVCETCCKPVYKEVVLCEKTECVWVADTKIEERTISVPTKVKKEIPCTVCETVMQQVECVDPCTGCKTTVCKPVSVSKTIIAVHEEEVKADYKFKVKVVSGAHQETKVVKVKGWCLTTETVATAHQVTVCEMVPYQTTVKVPVCTTACGTGCGCGH